MGWVCSSPGLFCSDTNFEVVKAGVSKSDGIGLDGRVLAYAELDKKFIRPSWAMS